MASPKQKNFRKSSKVFYHEIEKVGKLGGEGGSIAVWNFSENSPALETSHVPNTSPIHLVTSVIFVHQIGTYFLFLKTNHKILFLKLCKKEYESIATVGEIRVWWRADFQSGSRVLKKVF